MSPDAVVVGAGICGVAAAHFLAERSLDVLVLDRGAVAGGTTGLGEGNVLVSDKPPGPERELALRGRDLWLALGEAFPAARASMAWVTCGRTASSKPTRSRLDPTSTSSPSSVCSITVATWSSSRGPATAST